MKYSLIMFFWLIMCGLDIGAAVCQYKSKHYNRFGLMVAMAIWAFVNCMYYQLVTLHAACF